MSIRIPHAILLIFTIFLASCDGSSDAGGGSKSLNVRVIYSCSHKAVANATVVLGDVNGAMIASGKTDETGIYVFSNPPSNATVTLMDKYINEVLYDVNVPEVTFHKSCDSSNVQVGSLNVSVTSAINGVVSAEVSAGNDNVSSPLPVSHLFSFYSHELQSDGKVSVVALGMDNKGDVVGYGTALDQTVGNSLPVNIVIDKPVSSAQYRVENVPDGIKSFNWIMSWTRKHSDAAFVNDRGSVVPSSFSVPYLPDFETDVTSLRLNLDINNNGKEDSSVEYLTFASVPSNRSLDFARIPAIPSNPQASKNAGSSRPSFSWSGSDAGADAVYGLSFYGVGDVGAFLFEFRASPSRTSIVFPELPSFDAGSLKTEYLSLTVRITSIDCVSGYEDYLLKMYQEMPEECEILSSTAWKDKSSVVAGKPLPSFPHNAYSRLRGTPL